jgi:hypothetical protein
LFHLQRKWQARYGAHGEYYCIVGEFLQVGNYAKITAMFLLAWAGQAGL